MQLTGGRRVKRSISIDMTSVRFCTPEMIARYRGSRLLRNYIETGCSTTTHSTPRAIPSPAWRASTAGA